MSGQVWKVVGGADKGGILVRLGVGLKSEQADSRLSTGALVKELNLEGDRLNYALVEGTGPEEGWVSLKLKDKVLLEKTSIPETKASEPEELPPSFVPAQDGQESLRKYKAGELDAVIAEYRQILNGMIKGPPMTEPREAGIGIWWERETYVPVASAPGKKKFTFTGDSITHGPPMCPSAGWVPAIAQRNTSLLVDNAGWGGNFSFALLDPAAFKVPLPNPGDFDADYVCILIGTNDALSMTGSEAYTDMAFVQPMADSGRSLRLPKDWRTECRPSIELYERSLLTVVQKHKQAGARVALVTPPPLGEDQTDQFDSKKLMKSPFVVVSEMAAAVRRIAAAEGCSVVPLFECLCHRLSKLERKPIAFTHQAFGVRMMASIKTLMAEKEQGLTPKPYSEYGHANGRPEISHDLVHLTEDSGSILAALVQEWIDSEVAH